MSRLLARIMLAILLFPLAGMFYFIVFVVYVESRNSWSRDNTNFGFLLSGFTSWAFIALYWWMLWRKSVQWTDARLVATGLCFVGAAVMAGVLGVMIYNLEDELGYFVGTVTAPLLWQVGTVLVWRESAAERAARSSGIGGASPIVCPTCGYNLTGLTASQCPECGTRFTLDQLMASQPKHEQVEIEG